MAGPPARSWRIVFSGQRLSTFPKLCSYRRQFHRRVDDGGDKPRQFWNKTSGILGEPLERLQIAPKFPIVGIAVRFFERAAHVLHVDQHHCLDCKSVRAAFGSRYVSLRPFSKKTRRSGHKAALRGRLRGAKRLFPRGRERTNPETADNKCARSPT